MCLPLAPVVPEPGPSEDDHYVSHIPNNMAFINCYGQSEFPVSKQLEIQSFACSNSLDIIHLQECKIDEDSFAQCGFITSNYNVFSNKPDGSCYGTASLVRSDLDVSKIHTNDNGRILIFNAAGCTWANMYLPSGSSRIARASREEYFSLIIPQLLIHRLAQGAAGATLTRSFPCRIAR